MCLFCLLNAQAKIAEKEKIENHKTLRPPIGARPRWFVDKERFVEVKGVIERYLSENRPVLLEWIEEYNELCEKVRK